MGWRAWYFTSGTPFREGNDLVGVSLGISDSSSIKAEAGGMQAVRSRSRCKRLYSGQDLELFGRCPIRGPFECEFLANF